MIEIKMYSNALCWVGDHLEAEQYGWLWNYYNTLIPINLIGKIYKKIPGKFPTSGSLFF